jgi:hypothetical protein
MSRFTGFLFSVLREIPEVVHLVESSQKPPATRAENRLSSIQVKPGKPFFA